MSTHTAIATTALGALDAIQVATRAPGAGEVRIKVEYAGVIPFDTYVTDRGLYVPNYPMILGFTSAGTVAEIGSGVEDLSVGDRVTAFNFGPSENKALQEFVTLPRSVIGRVPDSVSLPEAATLPDNFVTSFYTLFNQLGLPLPASFPASTSPPNADVPVLVYGAGSTTGIYAVQLLHLAGYKKIIALASTRNHDYLRALGASDPVDYASPTVVEQISAAAGGDGKILLAVDCIAAENTTLKVLGKVMSPKGKLAVLLPVKEGATVTNSLEHDMVWEIRKEKTPFPEGTEFVYVRTFNYQQDEYLRDALMPKILPSLLESGAIKPSKIRLMDQGSLKDRVTEGLQLLRTNQISGEKVIVKITA